MYSHMMVGSNDLERSKSFYDGLFGSRAGLTTRDGSPMDAKARSSW
jgi:catechol 2,3-dioxygenase-like lactoylglutathione lyase family enzyme